MAHNIIRRARIIDAFHRAVALGSSRSEAFHTVGQSLGLDVQTVEWCVGEEEEKHCRREILSNNCLTTLAD
jgi:hypothetical protein